MKLSLELTFAYIIFVNWAAHGERPRGDFGMELSLGSSPVDVGPTAIDPGGGGGQAVDLKKNTAEDLDTLTDLFEGEWDKHVSVMYNSAAHYGGSLTELDEIRNSFRGPIPKNQGLPSNVSLIEHLLHFHDLNGEMSKGDDELQQHLDAYEEKRRIADTSEDVQAHQWGLTAAAKSVYRKVCWLGRMMLRLLFAVKNFITVMGRHIGNLYMGPGVMASVAEGCTGTTLTFAGDVSYLYRQHQSNKLVPAMQRVSVNGVPRERVATSWNPVTRFINGVSDLMDRCEDTRNRPAGWKPYPVINGFAFWFSFKGCALPAPHVRPGFGFGASIGLGLMRCLATRSFMRKGESGHIRAEADAGLLLKISSVFDHIEAHATGMAKSDGCLNSMAIYSPLFPLPFSGVGIMGSIKLCGVAPLKALWRYIRGQPAVKAAVKEAGPAANPKIEGGKVDNSAEVSVTDSAAKAAGMEAKMGSAAPSGPCSSLDCYLFGDWTFATGGIGVGITCGPLRGAASCVKKWITSKMPTDWTRGINKDLSPSQPTTLVLPKETVGYCCLGKGSNGAWATAWAGTAGAHCAGSALPLVKITARKGPTDGVPELHTDASWWGQRHCVGWGGFRVDHNKLALVHLTNAKNRQFWELKVPKVLGFTSVRVSKWLDNAHAIAVFDYLPAQPSHWCCCKVPRGGTDAECKALPAGDTNTHGTSACSHKKLGLPVVVYASGITDEVYPRFKYPDADDCEHSDYNFVPIWIPKYKSGENGDIHSMTEGLATEDLPKADGFSIIEKSMVQGHPIVEAL